MLVFNGNGYSEDWIKEAAKRGLPNLKNTPEALAAFGSDKNVKLFSSMNVLSEREFLARKSIMYSAYITQVKMEMSCLLDMIRTGVIPAILRDLETSENRSSLGQAFKEYANTKSELYSSLIKATEVIFITELFTFSTAEIIIIFFSFLFLLFYFILFLIGPRQNVRWFLRRRSPRRRCGRKREEGL